MPQTVNEALEDATTRRAVQTERYKNGVVRRMLRIIAATEYDIISILMDGTTEWNKTRLDAQLVKLRKVRDELTKTVEAAITAEIKDFSGDEVAYLVGMTNNSLPTTVQAALTFVGPSVSEVAAAAISRPFSGRLLSEWVQDLTAADYARMRDAVRIGFAEGESIDKVVRRITGTRAMRYKNGVREVTRRQTEAFVRTAIQHTANTAADQVWKANAPLLKGLRYCSVLDFRSTVLCASRDGKVFPLDDHPAIPAHFNCRSRYAPVTKSAAEILGKEDAKEPPPQVRPFIRSKKAFRNIAKEDRAALTGRVAGDTTFPAWLKRQDRPFVEEYLGKDRATLFLRGELSLDKFINDVGKEYTLSDLKRLHPQAFVKAGLD